MAMPRRTCHDDYPALAKTGTPVYSGPPSKLTPAGLERVKSMLLAGESARVAAEAVGYASEVSFSEAFFRLTGVRPGAFRKAAGVALIIRHGGFRKRKPRKIPDREGQKPLPRRKRQRDREGSSGT